MEREQTLIEYLETSGADNKNNIEVRRFSRLLVLLLKNKYFSADEENTDSHS